MRFGGMSKLEFLTRYSPRKLSRLPETEKRSDADWDRWQEHQCRQQIPRIRRVTDMYIVRSSESWLENRSGGLCQNLRDVQRLHQGRGGKKHRNVESEMHYRGFGHWKWKDPVQWIDFSSENRCSQRERGKFSRLYRIFRSLIVSFQDIVLDKLQGDLMHCKTFEGSISLNSCYVDKSHFVTETGNLNLKNLHKKSEIYVLKEGNIDICEYFSVKIEKKNRYRSPYSWNSRKHILEIQRRRSESSVLWNRWWQHNHG